MPVTLTKGSGPAVDMSKHREKHVDLAKRFDKAGLSLSKRGLDGIRAQVVLSLDHSGSMDFSPNRFYSTGVAQTIVERALGFALQVDADGVIPVYAFDNRLHRPVEVGIDKGGMFSSVKSYQDVVNQHIWKPNDMGGTTMAPVIANVTNLAKKSDLPIFHIIVGDGSPGDAAATTRAVIDSANHPVFHKFLAVAQVDYLQELDDLDASRRRVDNVDAKFLGRDVASMADLAFADAMTEEWDTWIAAATTAGIVT